MYPPDQVYHSLQLYIKTLFCFTGRAVLHLEVSYLQKGLTRAFELREPVPVTQIDEVMSRIGYHRYSRVSCEMPILSVIHQRIDFVPVDDYCYTLLFDEVLTLHDMQQFRLITNLYNVINS